MSQIIVDCAPTMPLPDVGAHRHNLQIHQQRQYQRKRPATPPSTFGAKRDNIGAQNATCGPEMQMPAPLSQPPSPSPPADDALIDPLHRLALSKLIFHDFYHYNLSAYFIDPNHVLAGNGLADSLRPHIQTERLLDTRAASEYLSVANFGSASGSEIVGLINTSSVIAAATAPSDNPAASAASSLASSFVGAPANASSAAQRLPYWGDYFYSLRNAYWPIHCVICVVICTLGIFANVTNIIVLTRPNMITAVNTILSAIAFADLIVDASFIPYLIHEITGSMDTDQSSFHSLIWAIYILFHAHTTVTAHTISMWLTCLLATWRCCVLCSKSAQRNWSVGLARQAVVAVVVLVPGFSIPNYLTFAIVTDLQNATAPNGDDTSNNSSDDTNNKNQIVLYKVSFSSLAEESELLKSIHFWIFCSLAKVLPCVILTCFTTVLIKKLLDARKRRLRLTAFGGDQVRKSLVATEAPPPPPPPPYNFYGAPELAKSAIGDQPPGRSDTSSEQRLFIAADGRTGCNAVDALANNQTADGELLDEAQLIGSGGHNEASLSNEQLEEQKADNVTPASNQRRQSQAPSGLIVMSCNAANSLDGDESKAATDKECASGDDDHDDSGQQATRILGQLIVESSTSASNACAFLTSVAPTKMLAAPVHVEQQRAGGARSGSASLDAGQQFSRVQARAFGSQERLEVPQHSAGAFDSSCDRLAPIGGSSDNIVVAPLVPNNRKRASVDQSALLPGRNRLVGSSGAAPMQLMKLQAIQRQLNQNETTTRLLLAVMIVFLICELPAGILAALCAILGLEFFDNVYQPLGGFTDLMALINSSVNFLIYCFMSQQFRSTFYQVVLRCPAPGAVPPE